jgi:peptidoglycan/xylan/chitin deacetylase (PgdA/CDA1 family)
MHSLASGLAAASVIASIIGGCGDRQGDDVRTVTEAVPTCTSAQAISSTNIHGASLPLKTIALTFDDGPGVRTSELSAYLKAEGIPAAFFVNGQMLTAGTAVLQQLVADGHVVANHTQTHASLTGRSTSGEPLSATNIVAELTQTDVLIAPFVTAKRFMFRAPYGDFDEQTAAAIEASPMKKYVGHISWDIGDGMGPDRAADWDCWRPGADGVVLTPQQCGDLYVKEIEAVGRGIVLCHDPYFVDDDPAKGGTVDMIKHIVPTLKAKGYEFVRTDAVPEIAALLPAAPPEDAGVDAADSGVSDAGTAPSSSSGGDARPGKPDPCAR